MPDVTEVRYGSLMEFCSMTEFERLFTEADFLLTLHAHKAATTAVASQEQPPALPELAEATHEDVMRVLRHFGYSDADIQKTLLL